MQKLFYPISILILAYLVYYYSVWFISFHVVEDNHFAFFTSYLPISPGTNMIELRVINLLLALLSGITFLLALKRSTTGNPTFLRILLVLNGIVMLMGLWQVLS
ncbi:MAG: hypothetical protein U5L96_11050 [Owenweeksia sp.]|nr:hypothetical protein [Owenweeksia sp.]